MRFNKDTLAIDNVISCRTLTILVPVWPPAAILITLIVVGRMFSDTKYSSICREIFYIRILAAKYIVLVVG